MLYEEVIEFRPLFFKELSVGEVFYWKKKRMTKIEARYGFDGEFEYLFNFTDLVSIPRLQNDLN